MANAFEIAFGWTARETLLPVEQAESTRKQRAKSRSQAAVDWIHSTGCSQRRAARRFSISQSAISQQLKANREISFCPACRRKMPIKK